jgi:hypothetical protein
MAIKKRSYGVRKHGVRIGANFFSAALDIALEVCYIQNVGVSALTLTDN